jgi:predicted ATPase
LATGRHPFAAAGALALVHALAEQAPLPPAHWQPELAGPLQGLLLHMLEKDPRRRPTAAEVAAALTEWGGSKVRPSAAAPPRSEPGLRVGRQNELAALQAGLASAVAGRGLFLCVTGEPGMGKTTLVEDFLAELATSGPACSIARGGCSERLAGAEAYLPILETLESLLRGAAGASAVRLLKAVAPTWYVQVAPSDEGSLIRLAAEAQSSSQERMKREMLAFLQELARLRPLVLFLEDVHWADVSTIDLLAYLGQHCAGLPLLLVLTYRPADLLLSQHPFQQVKLELQGRGVCRELALAFLRHADTVHYLALAFPAHRLPADFPAVLHARTEGNPLFLVDLLRYLQERGVIAQEQGHWTLTQTLPDLERELPESVRSLIQRKLDRLGEAERRLLQAASVQGYEFDAAVAAQVLKQEAAEVEERLEELARVHGLVRLLREQEFPDRTLTVRYAFVHVLYQNVLYAALQPTRKAAWNASVAQALLGFYGEHSDTKAAELALLFEKARDWARAAHFGLVAAHNAASVNAHPEAAALARRGLDWLGLLPTTPERTRQELQLNMMLGRSVQATRGFAAPEVAQAYNRARELCQQVKEAAQLGPILWGLWAFYGVRAEFETAGAMGEQLLSLAQTLQEPMLFLAAHHTLGINGLHLGALTGARVHLEQGIACRDLPQDGARAFLYGQDLGIGCRAFGSMVLWLLGYPEQARQQSRAAIALAQEQAHLPSRATAHYFAACVCQCGREPQAARELAEALLTLATEQGFTFWGAGGMILRGWALAEEGRGVEGIPQLRKGIAAWRATGAEVHRSYHLALLAEALGKAGQTEEGLQVVAEALTLAHRTEEYTYEAELHRLQGELVLSQSASSDAPVAAAEVCFRQALDVARGQQAKSLELRAALSLSRLYQRQGNPAEARQLLATTYGWFTEGHDTADLKEARALLESLC